MRRAPRRPLHPDFARAIRASGFNQTTLVVLAGFPGAPLLSSMLCHGARVTPLNADRLRKLATVVGHEGPLFSEGGER